MKKSLFEGWKVSPLPSLAGVKTPEDVARENTTRPNPEFQIILEKVDFLGATLENILTKPDTRQNKIDSMRIFIELAYELERLPKMNNSKVIKFSLAVKKSKKANYKTLRKIIKNIFGLKLLT